MSNRFESCVETPAAPEWLSKLESRREKIGSRGKLGHESGAGAPCNECGKTCPGLDLHFWRKVCRNCKCRKDQHMCQDNDLSGWAQFEILGQIRSKPAYMKIKALEDKKVELDWVPPNTTFDVVSDYMDKLGKNQIPVVGSEAAIKRKQQLEFQVPPHDLDAKLCDNLSESETSQLEQYVKKLRENCVGQGHVFRIGEINYGKFSPNTVDNKMQILDKLQESSTNVINDSVVMNLLNSEKLSNVLLDCCSHALPTPFVAFSEPLLSDILPQFSHLLREETQQILNTIPINVATVLSLNINGPFYDKILKKLASKNLNISKDPVLQPINEFRKEIFGNNYFKNDIEQIINAYSDKPKFEVSIKMKSISGTDSTFHSPLPVRNTNKIKSSALLKQDTPMRKVKLGELTIAEELGIPLEVKIEKDKILSKIFNSEQLRNAIQNPLRPENKNIIIAHNPMSLTNDDNNAYYHEVLSPATKTKIQKLELNKDCIQSGVIYGTVYDHFFKQLNARGICFENCKLLAPIKQFREELKVNLPFQKEVFSAVQHLLDCEQIKVNTEQYFFSNKFSGNCFETSKKKDSGFESKPLTSNYSKFTGDVLPFPSINFENFAKATANNFLSNPGIEDLNMNMCPFVNITSVQEQVDVNKNLNDLKIPEADIKSIPVLKCKDCQEFIMSGEVAVKAERAGIEIAWHPECFKCNGCRELLADLVYFFHGGNIYCGRDLALILKIPRCQACDELIFTKEYTAAEGATFHIKHFCCFQCDLALAGQQYIPEDKTNMPLCLKCYGQHYAEKCQNCKKIIGPTEQGVAWDKIHWHSQCFVCFGTNCGKSLIGGRFCIKENLPFCSSHCVNILK